MFYLSLLSLSIKKGECLKNDTMPLTRHAALPHSRNSSTGIHATSYTITIIAHVIPLLIIIIIIIITPIILSGSDPRKVKSRREWSHLRWCIDAYLGSSFLKLDSIRLPYYLAHPRQEKNYARKAGQKNKIQRRVNNALLLISPWSRIGSEIEYYVTTTGQTNYPYLTDRLPLFTLITRREKKTSHVGFRSVRNSNFTNILGKGIEKIYQCYASVKYLQANNQLFLS